MNDYDDVMQALNAYVESLPGWQATYRSTRNRLAYENGVLRSVIYRLARRDREAFAQAVSRERVA